MDRGGKQGREQLENVSRGQGMGSCPARLTLGGTYRRQALGGAKVSWGQAVEGLEFQAGKRVMCFAGRIWNNNVVGGKRRE